MTDLTLHEIAQRLSEIGGDVVGIRRAFDPPPPKLDSGDLPALWIFTDRSSIDAETDGIVNTSRTFRIQVAVLTLSEGDPYTRETRCRPLLDLVSSKFQGTPTLRNLPFVRPMGASVLSDSGIVILPEFGGQFIGFEVRLQVQHFVNRSFEEGE